MKGLLQNRVFSVFGIVLLLVLLVSIRLFENKLFYDPFLAFFKLDYQNKALPAFETSKLALHLFFRYLLNSVFTVGIVYLLFKEIKWVKFSLAMLLLLFCVFISIFLLLLQSESPDCLVLFYVRRFLIQPIPLLLFIPAFYFQKLTTK